MTASSIFDQITTQIYPWSNQQNQFTCDTINGIKQFKNSQQFKFKFEKSQSKMTSNQLNSQPQRKQPIQTPKCSQNSTLVSTLRVLTLLSLQSFISTKNHLRGFIPVITLSQNDTVAIEVQSFARCQEGQFESFQMINVTDNETKPWLTLRHVPIGQKLNEFDAFDRDQNGRRDFFQINAQNHPGGKFEVNFAVTCIGNKIIYEKQLIGFIQIGDQIIDQKDPIERHKWLQPVFKNLVTSVNMPTKFGFNSGAFLSNYFNMKILKQKTMSQGDKALANTVETKDITVTVNNFKKVTLKSWPELPQNANIEYLDFNGKTYFVLYYTIKSDHFLMIYNIEQAKVEYNTELEGPILIFDQFRIDKNHFIICYNHLDHDRKAPQKTGEKIKKVPKYSKFLLIKSFPNQPMTASYHSLDKKDVPLVFDCALDTYESTLSLTCVSPKKILIYYLMLDPFKLRLEIMKDLDKDFHLHPLTENQESLKLNYQITGIFEHPQRQNSIRVTVRNRSQNKVFVIWYKYDISKVKQFYLQAVTTYNNILNDQKKQFVCVLGRTLFTIDSENNRVTGRDVDQDHISYLTDSDFQSANGRFLKYDCIPDQGKIVIIYQNLNLENQLFILQSSSKLRYDKRIFYYGDVLQKKVEQFQYTFINEDIGIIFLKKKISCPIGNLEKPAIYIYKPYYPVFEVLGSKTGRYQLDVLIQDRFGRNYQKQVKISIEPPKEIKITPKNEDYKVKLHSNQTLNLDSMFTFKGPISDLRVNSYDPFNANQTELRQMITNEHHQISYSGRLKAVQNFLIGGKSRIEIMQGFQDALFTFNLSTKEFFYAKVQHTHESDESQNKKGKVNNSLRIILIETSKICQNPISLEVFQFTSHENPTMFILSSYKNFIFLCRVVIEDFYKNCHYDDVQGQDFESDQGFEDVVNKIKQTKLTKKQKEEAKSKLEGLSLSEIIEQKQNKLQSSIVTDTVKVTTMKKEHIKKSKLTCRKDGKTCVIAIQKKVNSWILLFETRNIDFTITGSQVYNEDSLRTPSLVINDFDIMYFSQDASSSIKDQVYLTLVDRTSLIVLQQARGALRITKYRSSRLSNQFGILQNIRCFPMDLNPYIECLVVTRGYYNLHIKISTDLPRDNWYTTPNAYFQRFQGKVQNVFMGKKNFAFVSDRSKNSSSKLYIYERGNPYCVSELYFPYSYGANIAFLYSKAHEEPEKTIIMQAMGDNAGITWLFGNQTLQIRDSESIQQLYFVQKSKKLKVPIRFWVETMPVIGWTSFVMMSLYGLMLLGAGLGVVFYKLNIVSKVQDKEVGKQKLIRRQMLESYRRRNDQVSSKELESVLMKQSKTDKYRD